MDEQATENSLFGWIELIENENLHKAVKSLSTKYQIFINYIVKECKTQQELASKYGINLLSVKNCLSKILRILKDLLFKK